MGKRFSILVIALFTGVSTINAQTKTVDSLKSLLIAHNTEDTVKVNLLNNLAYELRRTKPQPTDSLLKISLALADKLNYKKGKGYALAMQGARFYAQLKYKEADSVFAIGKQLLESTHDLKDESYMFRSWASMKMDKGDYATSLDYFLKAIKMAQDVADIKGAISAESSVGYLYNILQEFEK